MSRGESTLGNWKIEEKLGKRRKNLPRRRLLYYMLVAEIFNDAKLKKKVMVLICSSMGKVFNDATFYVKSILSIKLIFIHFYIGSFYQFFLMCYEP